jgi:hypothetical protein
MSGRALEDSSEEARPAAQQSAEDATEAAPEDAAEDPAADGGATEAVLAADVRVGQRVTDRADDIHCSEETVALSGETTNHIAQLVVAGQDAALVTEDTALAVEQAAQQTSEEAAVDRPEYTLRAVRGSGHRPGCTDAQSERDSDRTNPSFRHHCSSPSAVLTGLARTPTTGPMAEVEVSPVDISTQRA